MEEELELLEMDLDDIVDYLGKQATFEYGQQVGKAIENLIKGYKELEVLFSNTFKDNVAYLEKKYVEENYIPKSKVREKIEELKQERKKQDEEDEIHLFYDQIDITNIIEVLQELLEERN